MLHRLTELLGARVAARDGDAGTVYDFRLSQDPWRVEHLVVEAPPEVAPEDAPEGAPQGASEAPPLASSAAPRSHWLVEPALLDGLDMSRRSLSISIALADLRGRADDAESLALPESSNGPSVRTMVGLAIHDAEGEAGEVMDLVADDQVWVMRYVLASVEHARPARSILIAPRWIDRVDLRQRRLVFDLPREMMASFPPFDPDKPIEVDEKERSYDYDQPEKRKRA